MKTLLSTFVVSAHPCLTLLTCGLLLRYVYASSQRNARDHIPTPGSLSFHFGILFLPADMSSA